MKKLLMPVFMTAALLTACGSQEADKETNETDKEPTEQQTASTAESSGDFPQLTDEIAEDEALVDMNTSMGTIKIKLFPELAPKTVENFLTHAKDGYYDGVIFHRVIKDFMIQGGDPEGTGRGGESIYGEGFEDEISDRLYNFRGALSMANAGPGTNGSQFFIVQLPELPEEGMPSAEVPDEVREEYAANGGTPWLDGKHTVFGHVVEGMDIVDAIAEVETIHGDRPVEDIVIESIDIIQE
ncbi:peptidylprolyl isomerase [Planomicrobium okeanokoites]|uniref:peptidylprolyl isomerase n=1 Tax=Planomicrobium okeanokoites TaxID=244 RepID=UPI0030FA5F4E